MRISDWSSDVCSSDLAIQDTPPLTACMQHGDFVPWHIFEKEEEWVIFDAEHAHHELPRFYDLAYSYSRIYTRADDSNLARQQLALFIERIALERSDERRVGKECVSKCRSRCSP